MATREEWQRLIDLSWDLALVEDDLRAVAAEGGIGDYYQDEVLAQRILFERFGVDV